MPSIIIYLKSGKQQQHNNKSNKIEPGAESVVACWSVADADAAGSSPTDATVIKQQIVLQLPDTV